MLPPSGGTSPTLMGGPMRLETLELQRFRCFSSAHFQFREGVNLILGDNGSGKTSILEALWFLTHKRSFRSARFGQLIRDGDDRALVVSRFHAHGTAHRLASDIGRSGVDMRWNADIQPSRAQLIAHFPALLIEPRHAHEAFHEADARRRWLDEAMFHVEHECLGAWQAFGRVLQQRNAALQRSSADLGIWTQRFIDASERLTRLRKDTFLLLGRAFADIQQQLGWAEVAVDLEFRPGWSEAEGLPQHLHRVNATEKQRGFTMVGPHRADIRLQTDDGPARDRLSRGQQKVVALCLRLAQGQLMWQNNRTPIVLWDDWQSELAEDTQRAALALVRRQPMQVILSSPQHQWPADSPPPEHMFHVEHP